MMGLGEKHRNSIKRKKKKCENQGKIPRLVEPCIRNGG